MAAHPPPLLGAYAPPSRSILATNFFVTTQDSTFALLRGTPLLIPSSFPPFYARPSATGILPVPCSKMCPPKFAIVHSKSKPITFFRIPAPLFSSYVARTPSQGQLRPFFFCRHPPLVLPLPERGAYLWVWWAGRTLVCTRARFPLYLSIGLDFPPPLGPLSTSRLGHPYHRL